MSEIAAGVSSILAAAERVASVRAAADAVAPAVLDLTAAIAAVPSPTNDEGAKSLLVERLFAGEGLAVERDSLGDVVATIPGRRAASSGAPPVLVAAHIDTVFPLETPLRIERGAERMSGPGVGDNSLAVAAAIKLREVFTRAGEMPEVDILLTGNVGEEGLGNLRGIRAVMADRPGIGAVVACEGHNLGRVTHVAVGSRRFRITARGPGGHSWGDFGRANAIHALAKLIVELDAISLPRAPKTTLSVGVIEGGVSVNTIAPEASCLVDLRSIDEPALRRLSERVTRAVERSNRMETVTMELEAMGDRPAGVVPVESPIVQLAEETLRVLGHEASFDASSTDANVPIAAGVPAVCIGLTMGGNVHRSDEFIDLAPVPTGLAQCALLTLALSAYLSART